MKTTTAQPINGRTLAARNELALLEGLHRFGYLATDEVAALIWPASNTPRMAQRTLERLRERREISSREGPEGMPVHYLASRGARRLQEERGVAVHAPADGSKHVKALMYKHRREANAAVLHAVAAAPAGLVGYYTEHEVQQGLAPLKRVDGNVQGAAKIADAFLVYKTNSPKEYHLTWVEAERGHKNRDDMSHLVTALAHILGRHGTQQRVYTTDGLTYHVTRALVRCPSDTHARRIATWWRLERHRLVMGYSLGDTQKRIDIQHADGRIESLTELLDRTAS